MRIVQINTFPNKATGKIMMHIHNQLLKLGHDSYVIWGRGRKSNDEHEIYIDDKFGVYFHGVYTRLTDKTGFASHLATKKILKKLSEIKPDIIHLHNLHGYYINIEMLFQYIKKNNIRVVWTLHDCWAFTGHCAYFDFIGCNKWETICNHCPQLKTYPMSYKDNSKWNYLQKKRIFSTVPITIVTPSQWLANLVKKSFLKDNQIRVIYNGINTSQFYPVDSDFREKYHLQNKKIILGVASEWTERKGLNDFIKLSNQLEDAVQIILVGLNKEQIASLPKGVIGIERTESIEDLVKLYSMADLFWNPTYDDNFPTTNLEALACGTPVITYNTGGSPESITAENGSVTDLEDFSKNYKSYLNKKYNVTLNEKFTVDFMIKQYLNLYKEMI